MINCDYCQKMFKINDLFKCTNDVDRCHPCEAIRKKRTKKKKANRIKYTKEERNEYYNNILKKLNL